MNAIPTPTILWLAWKEWRRALYRAPTDRDFLYLTFLLGLLIALGLAAVSFERGLLTKYADSLLGRIEPYGFPVVAITDPNRPTQIDRNDIEVFGLDRRQNQTKIQIPDKVAEYKLYPYTLTGNMLTIVSDPRAHDPDFVGWAVYHNDPLWIWAKGTNHTA